MRKKPAGRYGHPKYEKRLGKEIGEELEICTFTVEEIEKELPCNEVVILRAPTVKDWREAEDLVSEKLAKKYDLSHAARGLADNIAIKLVGDNEYELILNETKATMNGTCTYGATQMDLMRIIRDRNVRKVAFQSTIVEYGRSE